MGEFVACCVLIALILGYPIFAICKNINELEDDIESLKQRIFELEDEVKELKKNKLEK